MAVQPKRSCAQFGDPRIKSRGRFKPSDTPLACCIPRLKSSWAEKGVFEVRFERRVCVRRIYSMRARCLASVYVDVYVLCVCVA